MEEVSQHEKLLHTLNTVQADLDDIFIYLDEHYVNDKVVTLILTNMTKVSELTKAMKLTLEDSLHFNKKVN